MTNTQQPTTSIYIGLGSNIGNRGLQLERAICEMKKRDISILRHSEVYQSEAWGNTDQAPFLNQVVEVTTVLSPEHLLDQLKAIEEKLGRQKRDHWHKREIDLDILYYGNRLVKTARLQIPHRYVRERKFVLIPLAEIAGIFTDPKTGETMSEILKRCKDESSVTLYNVKDQKP